MTRSMWSLVLCAALLAAGSNPGCTLDDNATAPASPTVAPLDQRLAGVWHLAGSDEGLEMSGDGSLVRLALDAQGTLQVGYKEEPGRYSTPWPGICALSWTYDGGWYSYTLSDSDSTLSLTDISLGAPATLIYRRSSIGAVIDTP